ncbi:hypothetical protein [Desulfothermus sp.]
MNILSIFLPILAIVATLFVVFKSFTSKSHQTSRPSYIVEERYLDEDLDDIDDVMDYDDDDGEEEEDNDSSDVSCDFDSDDDD